MVRLLKDDMKGICKLTHKPGIFVSSHLIPKALTKPEKSGLPFVQNGYGKRPSRRWSSWYDERLVTREGEDILAALDDWAIAELRKHKLVWSGWGPMQALADGHDAIGETGFGVRSVRDIDGKRLRLFFLSLLWRAAATVRPEFSEITIPSEDIERLRLMVLSSDPEPPTFYQIQLTQISTLGIIHNLTPLAMTKTIPAYGESPERTVAFFRFYFDGLVVHIHSDNTNQEITQQLGSLVVGLDSSITVSTVTYEISFQRKNLDRLIAEAYVKWPALMTKL